MQIITSTYNCSFLGGRVLFTTNTSHESVEYAYYFYYSKYAYYDSY